MALALYRISSRLPHDTRASSSTPNPVKAIAQLRTQIPRNLSTAQIFTSMAPALIDWRLCSTYGAYFEHDAFSATRHTYPILGQHTNAVFDSTLAKDYPDKKMRAMNLGLDRDLNAKIRRLDWNNIAARLREEERPLQEWEQKWDWSEQNTKYVLADIEAAAREAGGLPPRQISCAIKAYADVVCGRGYPDVRMMSKRERYRELAEMVKMDLEDVVELFAGCAMLRRQFLGAIKSVEAGYFAYLGRLESCGKVKWVLSEREQEARRRRNASLMEQATEVGKETAEKVRERGKEELGKVKNMGKEEIAKVMKKEKEKIKKVRIISAEVKDKGEVGIKRFSERLRELWYKTWARKVVRQTTPQKDVTELKASIDSWQSSLEGVMLSSAASSRTSSVTGERRVSASLRAERLPSSGSRRFDIK